jgi:hypothetical protein
MSAAKEAFDVVVRVWKSGNKTPILLFPEDTDSRRYTIGMWEEVGQHGDGDHQVVVQKTRLATDEEAQKIIKRYETLYDCKLRLKKRLKIDWRASE